VQQGICESRSNCEQCGIALACLVQLATSFTVKDAHFPVGDCGICKAALGLGW